jgi:hypothetical protein
MKIDFVLTACDTNNYYLNLYPYVHKVWKEIFNLDCYLILINDNIPKNLEMYKQYIILYENKYNIHTVFIAQVIRILYPCLFDNKNILITDVDILPISYSYFIESISEYKNENFITYTDRYIKHDMFAICYNVANSKIWKEIFNINNIEDINEKLLKWFNKYAINIKETNYTGKKNCNGWFTDQKQLYKKCIKWNNITNKIIIMNDNNLKFNRLHKNQKNTEYIMKNKELILDNIKSYTDIHVFRQYHKHINYLNKIIEKICMIV